MSFFSIMGRMIEGKPAFEDESQQKDGNEEAQPSAQESKPTAPQSTIDKSNENTFPVVYVKRVKVSLNGNNMEVYAQIVNEWSEEIMLDKIRLANATQEIDNTLRGNEEREFLIYRGPKLSNECFEAQLDYKTQNEGDYFQAVHDVKCTYDASDKTYTIDEMRLRRPIRDIYG
jgi:hypothetical protein